MSHPDPSKPFFQVEPDQPQELVTDYLISPQNSPERPTWYASNDLYTNLASSAETDLGFNAFDFFLPVGGGPPLHYHNYENEAWYGVEGDLVFSFGNQPGTTAVEPEYTLNVPEDTLVFGPRLRPHTYNNLESTEATVGDNQGSRTLSFTTPGGLDLFFDYVGIPVEDRDSPIPLPGPPTPETFNQLAEIGGRISGAPYFILPEADYTPPADALDYVLVLPENPDQELIEDVLPLADVEGYDIWQIDGDADIPLPTRPTFTGSFGVEYTSLLTLEETGNELAYNQFSLAPQKTLNTNISADDFPDPVVSENQEAFYVKEGHLSLLLDGEVKEIESDTLVYIAPGQEYSFANFETEAVESLAVTVPVKPEAERTILSPLASQADTVYQSVFLGDEADIFAPPDESDREVHGQNGNDQLSASQGDRLLGEEGDDLLNASSNGSQNLLDGGLGNDELLGGKDSELVGGEGDDILRIGNGGNNLLYGNGGADQFWLANNTVPDTVIEDRQLTDLGLPVLTDTKNTIVDFESGVDRIGISGLPGVSSFEDLKLLPSFGDVRSTSIVAEVEGIEGEISLGNVVDVYFNELSAEDFVFA
jgi:mannose-6-phosphate isomerase-like protein (cupin superfamily)